jgi:hypothetical protein
LNSSGDNELKGVDELGGTLRLGKWACRLAQHSFA